MSSPQDRTMQWAQRARIDLPSLDLAGQARQDQGGTLSFHLPVVEGGKVPWLNILDRRPNVVKAARTYATLMAMNEAAAEAMGVSAEDMETRRAEALQRFEEAFSDPAAVFLRRTFAERNRRFEDLILDEPEESRGMKVLSCLRLVLSRGDFYYERTSRFARAISRRHQPDRDGPTDLMVVTCTDGGDMYSLLHCQKTEQEDSGKLAMTRYLMGDRLTVEHRQYEEIALSIADRQEVTEVAEEPAVAEEPETVEVENGQSTEEPAEAEGRAEAEVVVDEGAPEAEEEKTTKGKKAAGKK